MQFPNRRLWLASLLALAFSLRAGYSYSLGNQLYYPDARLFDQMAWHMASEGRYMTDDGMKSERTPSFVIFLATSYKLMGHRFLPARLMQSLLGALLVVLVMALGRSLILDPNATWLAGLMTAVYPFFIYYDGQLLSDSFLTFWLAATLFLWYRWRANSASWSRALLFGTSSAILCLAKTIFIPYLAILMITEAFLLWRAKSISHPAQWSLALTLWLLPLVLWGLRNQGLTGHFFLDGHGGMTSMQAIVHHQESRYGTFDLNKFFAEDPVGQAAAAIPNESDRERFLLAQTKKYIRDNPARYLRESVTRFIDLWRFYPRPDLEYREGKRLITWISCLTEPFLILAGLFGLWKARNRWRLLYPVYLCIAWLTLVYSATSGSLRYRLPLMPLLIIFSAYGVCEIYSRRSSLP